MRITSYTADISVNHSFFGKASPDSFEPAAKLCHSVAKDHSYPEADEVKLLEIVHAAIGKFFKQYPKTRARIVVIRLFVGSSLKSLKFYAEGYFAPEYASWRHTRPTGDIIIAETDLYKQEYRQYLKELNIRKNENIQRFWTYCDQTLPKPGERVMVLVVELKHGQSPDDPDAKRSYDTDYGTMRPDGSWETENDWDEGQPWGIVAWASLYDAEEASKHNVDWNNVEDK